jgi:hypothetical protein
MFYFVSFARAEYKNAVCFIDEKSGEPYLKYEDHVEGDNAVAWARWNNSIHQDGWYKLHLHGQEGAADKDIMTCAGYLEGALSANGIFNHYALIREIKGYPAGVRTYPPKVYAFINDNLKYVRESVEAYADVEYWQEIGLILSQFDGLRKGYDFAMKDNNTAKMGEFDHWFFQSAGDMFDIAAMFPGDIAPAEEFKREHCSGLIRLTDDYSDLYFAHDAWSDYRELHGLLKEYNLPVKAFKARRMILSSRVGKLASYDDFYFADTGLFVIETTLNNYNDDLYKVCIPQKLFTWVRALHATWTSTLAKEWCETFIKHNSGTYNNQYVVVDSNKFKRFEKPTKDLVWIIEQYPGVYNMSDVTEYITENGYFPSVNTPFHEYLYNLAGYPKLVESLGIYGAYRSKNGPRALIMQRDAPRIKNFEDFKNFMRYNQYKRDPYSQGDPAQQIAARYDLREPKTPYGARNNFGDLDSKALRLTEAKTLLRMHAIASPPYDTSPESFKPVWEFGVPPFDKINYYGLPKRWNFTWLEFGAEGYSACEELKTEKDCYTNTYCGWCMYSQKCYPGDSHGPWFRYKCINGWKVEQKIQEWANSVIIPITVICVIFTIVVFVLHFVYKKKEVLP